jgi:26S proteasome regulatory subunit N8
MFAMFRKVNAREKVIGWYSTGPRLREADQDINDLVGKYVETPLLVICEVQPKGEGLPTTAYYAKDEIREDGTQKSQKVFVNIPTEVGATEAEEVGVEHLLRDVKDATISTLSTEVERMAGGLNTLKARLLEIQHYLELVIAGKLPVNHDIVYSLQDIFNLLPNIDAELTRSFAVKSNDMMMVVYVASLIRSVLALHNLINNKEQRVWREKEALSGGDSKKKGKDKEGKENSNAADKAGAKAEKPKDAKDAKKQ